jgi:outer membrane protein assembly factor BamE (lipoprotein component of BamABCDE complex)
MKKYSKFCLILGVLFVGCFSTGNKEIMDVSKTDQIQKGKTTKEEARILLGDPNHTTIMPSGEEIWVYSYTRATARPTSFIPVVGLFAGGTDVKGKTISLIFDANGVLKTTSQGQMKGGGGSVFD